MDKSTANNILNAYSIDDKGASLKALLSPLVSSGELTKDEANEMLSSYALDDKGATLKSLLSPKVSITNNEQVAPTSPKTYYSVNDVDDLTKYFEKIRNDDKIAKPFTYTVTAAKDMDSIPKGTLLDRISIDIDDDVDTVKNKWMKGNNFIASFKPDEIEITKTVSEDPEVIEKYNIQRNFGKTTAQSMSEFGKEYLGKLGEKTGSFIGSTIDEMPYTMPRSARAAIQKDAGELQGLSAVSGDVLSAFGRSLSSLLGATGEEGDYMTNVKKQLGYLTAPPRENKIPYIGEFAQNMVRDPMLLPSVATGIGAIRYGAPKLGELGYDASKVLSSYIKPPVVGAGAGVIDVAGRDVMDDYSTGNNKIGMTDYLLGAAGGAAIPMVYPSVSQLSKKVADKVRNVFASEPYKFKPLEYSERSPYAFGIKPEQEGPLYAGGSKRGLINPPVETTTLPKLLSEEPNAPVIFSPGEEQPLAPLSDFLLGRVKSPDIKPYLKQNMDVYSEVPRQGGNVIEFDPNKALNAIEQAKAQAPSAGVLESFTDRVFRMYPRLQNVVNAPVNFIGRQYQRYIQPSRTGLYNFELSARNKLAGGIENIGSDVLAYKVPLELNAAYEPLKEPISEIKESQDAEIVDRYKRGIEQQQQNNFMEYLRGKSNVPQSIIQAQYERYLQEKARQQGGR